MPLRYSSVEYTDIIFVYGYCNGNARAAAREYRRRFPERRTPHHTNFPRTFNFSREHGRFPNVRRNVERRIRNPIQHENIVDMAEENPSTSTRRISQALMISQSKVWRTLKKEEHMHPFHLQKVQRLEPGDEVPRLTFCRWISLHPRTVPRILFTDEASFTRDGVTNLKNSHIWAHENPHAIVQKHSQHKFSWNVWCGVVDDTLIGPHFFDGNLTGAIYLDFLQMILPELLAIQDVNLRGLYFQQDGAPPHYSREVRAHLNDQFPNRWIGRAGPHSWPARSPDLTVLDYYVWGRMKDIVYRTEVNTRDELRERIVAAAEEIRNDGQEIRKATRSLLRRCTKCIEAGGWHFENLL